MYVKQIVSKKPLSKLQNRLKMTALRAKRNNDFNIPISQENISTNNTNISFLGADGAPPGSSHAMPNSLIKTIDGVESEIMTNNNNSEEIIAHNLSVSTNNTPETAICEKSLEKSINTGKMSRK